MQAANASIHAQASHSVPYMKKLVTLRMLSNMKHITDSRIKANIHVKFHLCGLSRFMMRCDNIGYNIYATSGHKMASGFCL